VSSAVGDAVTAVEAAYPPELAQEWDAVGLVCADIADPGVSDALAMRLGLEGTGQFLPGAAARPAIGVAGRLERVAESEPFELFLRRVAVGVLRRALGGSVEVLVSQIRTDPWTTHGRTPE